MCVYTVTSASGAQELKSSSTLDSWVQLSPEQCAMPNIATLSPWVSVARQDERPERGGFGDIVPCVFRPVLAKRIGPEPLPAVVWSAIRKLGIQYGVVADRLCSRTGLRGFCCNLTQLSSDPRHGASDQAQRAERRRGGPEGRTLPGGSSHPSPAVHFLVSR
jgi:hypothetical protein